MSKDYKLALASSSSKKNVNLFLDKSKTKKFFDVVLSGDDVKNAKPDPEIYLTVLKSLKYKDQEVYIIEDSKNGILAGIKAKIKVIGITSSLSSEKLKKLGVTKIIDNIDEIINILWV